MSDQPDFEYISGGEKSAVDVVFIHGLTGDASSTWITEGGAEFWPTWLFEDMPGLALYSLGFPSSLFAKWAKKEMDMFERAGNVLELFAGYGLGKKPIVFITHSLGGILIKMILRKACDAEDEDWKSVANAARLVVFLSTPHTGASLASALDILPGTSKQIKLLANDTGFLEDLNLHYRKFANGADHLATSVYYEKHATKGVKVVVARESADPGVAGSTPVPVDKDHINICKPQNRDDIVYRGILRRLKKVVDTCPAIHEFEIEEHAEPSDINSREHLHCFSVEKRDLGDGTLLYHLFEGKAAITFSRIFCLWQNDDDFQKFFISIFREVPFPGFIWEASAFSEFSVDEPFEFVIKCLPKASSNPDHETFAEYFDSGNSKEGIVTFKNIGGDALLVVPSPLRAGSNYGGLAEFTLEAPIRLQRALWRELGRQSELALSKRPIWLSVAGGGIFWLHIRMDSRPKYYRHVPYIAPR